MTDPSRRAPEGVPVQATLREVIETLAPIERPPCSPGEREAAEWIAHRLSDAGCSDVRLEDEDAWGTFPPTITAIGVLGFAGAAAAARGRRWIGGVLASLGAGALLDEIQNGPRLFRRAVRRKKQTVNVIAAAGHANASRTLVVLAHHDAAQTGLVFDQSWAKALHRRRPDLMEAGTKQIPQWWIGLAPGVLTLMAALLGRPRLARAGMVAAALGTAAMADILRSPTVPGANDNLSGVAVLVALAEALRDRPVPGVRVMLVSCGAEEALQEGIRAFMSRHEEELGRDRTWFLNFDTVGSPDLVMLEGEGPAWMEEYADPSFRDLVADCARRSGIPLERGIRARASTDSIIPSRAGYPAATLVSLMPWRMPGNYHQMSDVPGNINYHALEGAARLGYAVAQGLGRRP
ncbi:MAG: M28 family peptidase [Actinomycetota bacterium]|nr:M28 family peptidase [Actinomycetota bacterium]